MTHNDDIRVNKEIYDVYKYYLHSSTGVGFYLITFSFTLNYLLYILPLQSHTMIIAEATHIGILSIIFYQMNIIVIICNMTTTWTKGWEMRD